MQWLNQLFHSIAGIAHALTEILRFLYDIRETERESELLERMEVKAVGEIPERIDIMERLKISKKTYDRYVADRHLNPSEMGGKHYYPDADISEALKRSKKCKRGQ